MGCGYFKSWSSREQVFKRAHKQTASINSEDSLDGVQYMYLYNQQFHALFVLLTHLKMDWQAKHFWMHFFSLCMDRHDTRRPCQSSARNIGYSFWRLPRLPCDSPAPGAWYFGLSSCCADLSWLLMTAGIKFHLMCRNFPHRYIYTHMRRWRLWRDFMITKAGQSGPAGTLPSPSPFPAPAAKISTPCQCSQKKYYFA